MPPPRASAAPLADLVATLLTPACRRRGVATAHLLLAPETVFGEAFGAHAAIERVIWPRGSTIDGGATGATLVVRVDPTVALALQHAERQIIERINVEIGWPAVARLRLTQTSRRAEPSAPPAPPPPPDPAAVAEIARTLPEIEHPDLKAALARLGASVVSAGSRARRETP